MDWIRKRVERGTRPAEIAVLSRSSRSIETVELALKFQKLPYRKYGGLTLGDSAEVKDFIAFLRLAFNPSDRVALVRCLTLFPGVGEASAENYASADDQAADELFAVERSLPKGAGSLNEWLAKLRATHGLGPRGEYLLHVIYPAHRAQLSAEPRRAHGHAEEPRQLDEGDGALDVRFPRRLLARALHREGAPRHNRAHGGD
ncbi:MAG: 3'-5' exonuclease [Verrucomicrobiota bacterium]